jgi:tetratricopeptide (TPR) repeat protein
MVSWMLDAGWSVVHTYTITMAELQALELYEQSKDTAASLAKYREVWSSMQGEKGAESDTLKEEKMQETQTHNEGILNHLSSLRRRRRRPADHNNETYRPEASGDLADMLSTMVTNLSSDEQKSKWHNRLVATYNLGLVHYSSGKIDEALNAVLPDLHKIISRKTEDSDGADTPGLIAVAVRIAFLVLDCIVRKHGGDGSGVLPPSFILDNKEMNLDPQAILKWLENSAIQSIGEAGSGGAATNKDELKFRVHLYRSKLLFIGTNTNSSTTPATKETENDMATRTRISRKELKSAMDLYQNKLSIEKHHDKNEDSLVEKTKPAGKVNNSRAGSKAGGSKLTKSKGSNQSDVSSVTSAAGGSLVTSTSEGLWATGNADKGGIVASATFEGMPNKNSGGQQVPSQQQQEGKTKRDNPDLHVQHEAVLYLKANLECLRGNTTKSLKLCSEARLAGRRSRGDQDGGKEDETGDEEGKDDCDKSSVESQMASQYDEAIYYNNLGLVHQSTGKVHLALHYYSFALDCMSKVFELEGDCSSFVWSDGISRPDITAEILYNTSVCAYQAGEFNKAYQSMARCMSVSPELYETRPRCWLRMGQSCIGEYLLLLYMIVMIE